MGASGNRLVLADVSANLKLFARPPGPNSSVDNSWSCQLVQSPHTGVVGDMAASTCGQWLLTGGHDQTLCLWRLVESEDATVRPKLLPKSYVTSCHEAHISAVCFTRYESHLSYHYWRFFLELVFFWLPFSGHFRDTAYAFSASTDGILKAWNVSLDVGDIDLQTTVAIGDTAADGLREMQSIRGAHGGAINCIHTSINGKLLATGSRDKTAKVNKLLFSFIMYDAFPTWDLFFYSASPLTIH